MTNDLGDEILHEMGFSSDAELRTFLQKLNQFFYTLTGAEQNVLRTSLGNAEDAARTFNVEVTQDQLRDFIQSRQPEEAAFTGFLWGLFAGGGYGGSGE